MSKITIIEGNSSDKDNVRVIMVKGEKGEQGDLNHNDIIDNLISTDNTKVLSAKQGKFLKDLVDKKIIFFDNVTSMKLYDLNLGNTVRTLGFHTKNDGGSALYKVRSKNISDTVDEAIIIQLQNENLVAELIPDYPINPNQFGCYGDLINDDSIGLQKAINYILNKYPNDYGFCPYLKGGNYYLTSPITINTPSQFSEWKIELNSIKGHYNGYVIDLKGAISSCELTFDVINNDLGGCIKCVTDAETYMGTSKINSNFMHCNTSFDCIHLEKDDNYPDSWINDNEINVKRFGNGRYGLYAKKCNQLIINHSDFEYGACYLENCNNALLIAPHLIDIVSNTYVLETVGECKNLIIIGGGNGGLSFEETLQDKKYKLSSGTFGGIVSYQEAPNLESIYINKSPFVNIIEGKLIRIQPYLFNLNVGSDIYDTRNLTSLECPTFLQASNDTTDIILDKAIYGGFGKINEIIIWTNNTSLNLKLAYKNQEPILLKTFTNSLYKKYKLNWFRDNKWFIEEYTNEIIEP